MATPAPATAAAVQTRRRFLSTAPLGLAGIAAASSATIAAAAPADDLALGLWERRHALRQPILDAERARVEAEGRTAAWALPGPEFLESDGSLSGPAADWPAIEGIEPSPRLGARRLLRPSPAHLRQALDVSTAIFGRARAVATYRAELRALAERRRRQAAEQARSGLMAALAALAVLHDELRAVNDQIEALSPATPNGAAARLLVEAFWGASFREPASDSAAVSVALIALAHLRPALRGIIKTHVDELLGDPGMRLGSALAYVGDSDGGLGAPEAADQA
jgi:hypothetical protein